MPAIPESGRLMLDSVDARSAIHRQRSAIRAFQFGDFANPKLANVIVEPDGATHIPPPALEYYQDFLSEDKKEAVSKAVASNELFLIQGTSGHRQDGCYRRNSLADSAAQPRRSHPARLPIQHRR